MINNFRVEYVGTAFFTTDGKSAVRKSQNCIEYVNLAHTIFITNLLLEKVVWFLLYSTLRLRLVCFVVYSTVNFDKVRECNRYIIYINTVSVIIVTLRSYHHSVCSVLLCD